MKRRNNIFLAVVAITLLASASGWLACGRHKQKPKADITNVLAKLGKQSGGTRYNTIQTLVNEGGVPAELTTDQMLEVIGGSTYRTKLIGMLIDRLPTPLPSSDILKIVQPVKGGTRYKTIELIARSERIPAGLTMDEINKIVSSSTYRKEAIGLLTKGNNMDKSGK